jgi:predicted dehydrogenase
MVSKRTVLLVGCGSIGQRHARLLGEREDISLWICDPVEENLVTPQNETRVDRVFADYRMGLQEQPDMVWVCTPNRLHAPVAIDALNAGADVFCEKPLADTVEAAQAIVDTVEQSGKTCMLGYSLRWNPGYQFMAQAIQSGQIGAPVAGRVRLHGYESLLCARTNYRQSERGALLLDYSHEIDALRWFLGEIVEARAFAATLGSREKSITPNIVAGILRFAGGQVATLQIDYVQLPGAREIDIFADKGMLHYNTGDGFVRCYTGGDGDYHDVPGALPRDDYYRNEIQSFLDAVDGKCAPVVTAQDGLQVMKAVFELVTSYEGSLPPAM